MWSDPRLVAIAKRCIPVADEVYRLQTGEDAECRFFQAMIGQKRPGGSRQGIYLATPGGRLLARLNSLSADRVLRALEEGLERWDALDDAARTSTVADASFLEADRWEADFPKDGLVLEIVKRDLPRVGSRWNRDHAWFTKKEALSVKEGAMPKNLALRLARFHLVDNARGQCLPYAKDEIEKAEIVLRVLESANGVTRYEISGVTRNRADAWTLGDNYWKPHRTWPRGIDLTLKGTATWDAKAQRFTQFDVVAVGTRFGRTIHNGRGEKGRAKSRIGMVIRLAPDLPRHRVAPTFINVYDAPWVRNREKR